MVTSHDQLMNLFELTQSTSKYEEVSWNEEKKRWQLEFDFHGKKCKYYFDNEFDAIKTRNRAYKKMGILSQNPKICDIKVNLSFFEISNSERQCSKIKTPRKITFFFLGNFTFFWFEFVFKCKTIYKFFWIFLYCVFSIKNLLSFGMSKTKSLTSKANY